MNKLTNYVTRKRTQGSDYYKQCIDVLVKDQGLQDNDEVRFIMAAMLYPKDARKGLRHVKPKAMARKEALKVITTMHSLRNVYTHQKLHHDFQLQHQ